MCPGGRSDSRRKDVIEGTVANRRLIVNILRRAKGRFDEITSGLEGKISEVLRLYLDELCNSLDIIRKQNVVQESETDPGFRHSVEERVQQTNALISDIKERIEASEASSAP